MPAYWNANDERKYSAIVRSCRYPSKRRCKSMASAVVNRDRRRQGRTLKGLSGFTVIDGGCFRTPEMERVHNRFCGLLAPGLTGVDYRRGAPVQKIPKGKRRHSERYWSELTRCMRELNDPRECQSIASEYDNWAARADRNDGLGIAYGLPKQRKYPLNTCGRAKNAKGRATQMLNDGHLTRSQWRQITKRAAAAERRLCRA